MSPEERAETESALKALGVTAADFNGVGHARTYEEACTKLDEVKDRVRKAYRRLALELHPDHTGNDPEKTKLFIAVTRVKADIETLTVDPPLPPMPVPFPRGIPVVIVQYGGIGRPPPGHPAANRGFRHWGTGSATTTVGEWPVGVQVPRGPGRR